MSAPTPGDPARSGLVRSRTALINTARGLSKSYGERLRERNPRNMNPEKAEQLSPELQAALEPLLAALGTESSENSASIGPSYPFLGHSPR